MYHSTLFLQVSCKLLFQGNYNSRKCFPEERRGLSMQCTCGVIGKTYLYLAFTIFGGRWIFHYLAWIRLHVLFRSNHSYINWCTLSGRRTKGVKKTASPKMQLYVYIIVDHVVMDNYINIKTVQYTVLVQFCDHIVHLLICWVLF